MDEVKESCPLHVTLICRLYYPFPWSQISHNSCSFFAHCIQVFSLVNVPDDARQKSGRCWRTWYCNMFDSPLPALDITAAFVVVPALSKYVFFLVLTGNKFHAPKHGMGWMPLPSPFPASDCAEDSRKRQTWEARRSNPIRTAEFLSVAPKTFYALLHHRVAADFLPLTPPPTEECLLWGGWVHISFSCHANSLIL